MKIRLNIAASPKSAPGLLRHWGALAKNALLDDGDSFDCQRERAQADRSRSSVSLLAASSTLSKLSMMGLLLAIFTVTAAPAAQVTPVYDVRFLSGQNFFDGDTSSLSGNLNVMASPAVKFNERWSLIPTYIGAYEGTRDVRELGGGGTLFNDSMNHGVFFKGIRQTAGAWRFKATTGARFEFLRETEDEGWGEGLFDYRKFNGGLEAEYAPSQNVSWRGGYDYYALKFPNYESLESAQDPTLSRELAGKNVIDSANHMASFGVSAPLPGQLRWTLDAYVNQRLYDDQPVVAASGDLTSTERKDQIMSLNMSFVRPLFAGESLRVVGELAGGYAQQSSNQNHYDARKTVFIKDFYDYDQASFSPRVTMALGEAPWIMSLGADWSRRAYSERPIQNPNGDYLGEKLNVTNLAATFGLSYPMTKSFQWRLVANLGWGDSNMQYEKVFTYNYKIANYMAGFSYAY